VMESPCARFFRGIDFLVSKVFCDLDDAEFLPQESLTGQLALEELDLPINFVNKKLITKPKSPKNSRLMRKQYAN
jgi:hypothetical protein